MIEYSRLPEIFLPQAVYMCVALRRNNELAEKNAEDNVLCLLTCVLLKLYKGPDCCSQEQWVY